MTSKFKSITASQSSPNSYRCFAGDLKQVVKGIADGRGTKASTPFTVVNIDNFGHYKASSLNSFLTLCKKDDVLELSFVKKYDRVKALRSSGWLEKNSRQLDVENRTVENVVQIKHGRNIFTLYPIENEELHKKVVGFHFLLDHNTATAAVEEVEPVTAAVEEVEPATAAVEEVEPVTAAVEEVEPVTAAVVTKKRTSTKNAKSQPSLKKSIGTWKLYSFLLI